MNGLFRRGGVWWARLVVPGRLRQTAGRREYVQSTRTHDKTLAKLIATAMLARWREQLFRLDNKPMDHEKISLLVGGGAALTVGEYMAIGTAVETVGFDVSGLLREVQAGRLGLWCLLGAEGGVGHSVPTSALEMNDPALGRRGGYIVPLPRHMPAQAETANFTGKMLGVTDADEIAGRVLADGMEIVELATLTVPGRPDWVYCPNDAVRIAVKDLQLSCVELEAVRSRVVAAIPPERIAPAPLANVEQGKWADKLFSGAVREYCTRTDGLKADVASEIEIRQRQAGLMLFAEFQGDLPLRVIDADRLRAFREQMREFPDHVNRLKAAEKGATMTETIDRLKEVRPDYKRMTDVQRHQRMLYLAQLFAWLKHEKYIYDDPCLMLKGETGLTKKERNAKSFKDEEDDARRGFSDAELQLFFGEPEFKTGNGLHVTKGNEKWRPFQYWAPLIALYGGMRRGEIAQLYLSDVVQDGVHWCFDINARTSDKSLKNTNAVRIVPIHPKLVELGFLEYCDRLRAAGFRRVFPDLRNAGGDVRYGKELGRVMTKVIHKKLGFPDEVTFHSFRHRCNGALQRVEELWPDPMLRVYIRYKVMGHEMPKDVNVSHYTWVTPAELAQLVDAATFPIPEIHAFDIEHAMMRLSQYLPNGPKDEDWHGAAPGMDT